MATSSPEPNEKCSMALLNINGLRNKTDEIRYIIEKHKLHVLALCETKIDSKVKDSEVYIKGFRMWRKDRTNYGGGVALYVQDHIETTLRSDLMETEAEIIWVEMKLPERSVLVGSCYRPPNDDLGLIEIYHTMTLASKEKIKRGIFLMGDLNIYWNDELVENTPKAISVLGLTQVVKVKTRYNLKSSSSTCIDHIYTNVLELCSEPESTATGCTDHNLITFTVKSMNIPQRIRRSNKEFDQNQFKEDMKAVQWRDVLTETNPTKALSKFTEKFLSVANKPALLQTQDVYDSLRLNEELRTVISDRDKIKQAVIERRQPWEKIRLLALKKRVSTHSQKDQKAYFVQEFEKAKTDSKALLKVFLEYFGESLPVRVINITKKGTATSEAGPLDFIHQPYSALEFVAEGSQVQNNMQEEGPQQFSFKEIDAETVRTLVMHFCDHAAHGIDETEADNISDSIGHILNRCFSSNKCPSQLKTLKKNIHFRENSNIDSVHVMLASIFDLILFQQAKKHFIDNSLIPSPSLDEEIKEIKSNWDTMTIKGKRVQAVFLDFSSSFDTISHDLLMEKLTTSGFSDSARSLTKTFLSIRKGSRGLPRQSFLARLLFTVFINNLRKVLETSSSAVCDSCIMIYCADTDTEKLKTVLDNEVESVHKWAKGFSFTFTETRPEPLKCRKISDIYDILDSLLICHQDQLNWIRALEKIVQLSDVWYNHKVKEKIGDYFGKRRLGKVGESVINSLLLFQPELRDL
ncbi:uncharacterized protein LOC110369265 isoform X1 [Fundulus heteroclitus]|uniref:uncharacterized protein LOC110369265 isoform X1 n=1 Tax=Fundulus heteroclitus TaxID=8078 RepID=UPI00165C5E45|nr:uncharacterized protein LOC110369265 isoform X1 [Fundulus heteroclitus]XP_035986407.1 uncharacterized protein LOC110369265 isoform X1 [Fundulus heteroclitus]XP_035986408.1 uncharacterized protein LOC110369265 isoform X1 [Fundulus heteroclitus]